MNATTNLAAAYGSPPNALIGTVDEVIDELDRHRQQRGFTSYGSDPTRANSRSLRSLVLGHDRRDSRSK